VLSVFWKILLAYNASESTLKAFDVCLQLASGFKGAITMVGVIRPSEFAVDVGAQTVLENAQQELSIRLAELQRRARFAGIEPRVVICRGNPVEETLRVAHEWPADVIVTSRAREGPLRRWFPELALSRLITQARCTVLVVR
jgi:nucleotide-binding universal stress UspA family protein